MKNTTTFNPAEQAYDYREALAQDIRDYLQDNDWMDWGESLEDIQERAYDELWTADSVTGNASGSYTCNRWVAENYLCHNWDLALDALQELGGDLGDAMERGPEYIDLSIRCYLLGEVLAQVLEEDYTEPEEE